MTPSSYSGYIIAAYGISAVTLILTSSVIFYRYRKILRRVETLARK